MPPIPMPESVSRSSYLGPDPDMLDSWQDTLSVCREAEHSLTANLPADIRAGKDEPIRPLS